MCISVWEMREDGLSCLGCPAGAGLGWRASVCNCVECGVPVSVTMAVLPGSTSIVLFLSSNTAGPCTVAEGAREERGRIDVSTQPPLKYTPST